MAQKESTHREKVDKLETQIRSQETELLAARRQYDDLVVLSRDQVRLAVTCLVIKAHINSGPQRVQ